jgi:hypothetical protein
MVNTKILQRNQVIWLGNEPETDIKLHYEQRGMILLVCSFEEVREKLNLSRAIVVPYDTDTTKLVRRLILEDKVFQYGTIIYIIPSQNGFIRAQRELEPLLRRNHGRLFLTANQPYEVAQRISWYDSGPSENIGLIIEGVQDEDLCQLLRRAFWDCSSLNLTLLSGGSSSQVFRADIIFHAPAGPSPLPFFVKYDRLDKIRMERNKYEQFVVGFIPFNYRPNLISERCIEGALLGLLVGNFVEHSEALTDTALRGTFTHSIYSLFHQAMRGWQAQAYCEPQIRYTRDRDLTLVKSLVEDNPGLDMFPKKQLDDSVKLEISILGCVSESTNLIDKVNALPTVLHVRGPIHGDLHAWNIHVRGTDAILIDFYRTGLGPLLWDPATLEISLCFGELYDKFPSTVHIESWRIMVEQLYHIDWINCPLKPPKLSPGLEGIWTCIREIRLYGLGLEVEANTYRQALAIQLLKQSLRSSKQLLPGSWGVKRLAYAYFLAERLL